MNSRTPRTVTIPILGVTLELKADVVGALALVVGLSTAGHQIFSTLRGSNVTLFAPEQTFFTLKPDRDGMYWLRIGARMAYVNDARPQYVGTIVRETVEFDLAGVRRRLAASSWTDFTDPENDGDRILLKRRGEARPFGVAGNSSVSHETYFSPTIVRCGKTQTGCNPNENFVSAKDAVSAFNALDELKVTFVARLHGEPKPLRRHCYAEITDDFVAELVGKTVAATTCWRQRRR